MPEFCTCGALLPDDARFCHKCGKSQRPEPVLEAEEPVADLTQRFPVTAVTADPIPAKSDDVGIAVGFNNPFVIRASLFAASIAALLDLLPVLNLFGVLWALGAGFASVMIYKRGTGKQLSIRNGAKLGWITGVLTLLILMVLFTVMVVVVTTNWPAIRSQLAVRAVQDPMTAEVLRVFDDRNLLMRMVPFSFLLFGFYAAACAAGGALGAKITGKD